MQKYIIILFVVIMLSSCFKEDDMVTPHNPGEVSTVVIPMTMYYSNQVYFNMAKEEIISINNRSIFDLNFSCNDSTTIIRLNTANFAKTAETIFDNLELVTDTANLTWNFDVSSGNTDSLAISNWINIVDGDTVYSNKVWVINRGVNSMGIPLGLKKVQFTKIKANTYYFTYSNMDNSDRVEATVKKDDVYSHAQFSFSSELVEQTEPETNNWDLLFTQYTTMLTTTDGEPYPYLLTGVLQNQGITSIALDTTMLFNDIVLSDTANFNFSNDLDKIGYNWKELKGDVNTGNIYYEIRIDYNYIIVDENLYYYKLRFVNFYDPLTGEKGYPTFEYVQL